MRCKKYAPENISKENGLEYGKEAFKNLGDLIKSFKTN